MSAEVEICMNQANAAEIADHLYRCDADFMPPLSDRVEIGSYARKIANKATRFEAWAGDDLVGLVAAYCNDSERRVAYITSVSVLRGWLGRGIASRLMERCICYVKGLRYESIALDVDQDNVAALRLYGKQGFAQSGRVDRTITMHLRIDKQAADPCDV